MQLPRLGWCSCPLCTTAPLQLLPARLCSQAQHFGTNGDLWAWMVLSKSSVPVCLRMCGRKLSILQAHPACLSSLWDDQHWLISLSNWSVLCIPLKAPSKPRVKGQMSPIMKGEVAYFTTRFEKNPIYSSSGTIMASATYFILKAEPRMQVRMTRFLGNLYLQEAEGRNMYKKKFKIVKIPRQ